MRNYQRKIKSLEKGDTTAKIFLKDYNKLHKITASCDKANTEIQQILDTKVKKYEDESMDHKIKAFWSRYRTIDVATCFNKYNL